MEIMRVRTDRVIPNPLARQRERQDIERLAASMNELGLLNPITAIRTTMMLHGCKTEAYRLVAGSHRLEAAKMLGWAEIDAMLLDVDVEDTTRHRLIEISENLHRAELSALERAQLMKEWVELTGQKPVQVEQVSKGGRGNRSGEAEAARQLGVDRVDVHRSLKIASLSPEAQEVARENGLADNKSALLDAARRETPEAQVAALRERKQVKPAPSAADEFEARENWLNSMMKLWNKVSDDWRQEFLYRVS